MTTEYIVAGDVWVNVRFTPDTNRDPLGHIPNGQHVQVIDIVGNWAKVALSAGQCALVGNDGAPAVGWMFSGLLRPVVPPAPDAQPPQPTRTRLGVNIIGGNADVIEYWYAAGCRRFQITFNPDAACQLKQRHPDCDVSHRALFNSGGLPSKAHFFDKHGYCLDAANKVRVYGLNENDQIGDGGNDGSQPDVIRKRAEWDAQAWQWCKDRGVEFVGGGFAMGTPNIVVPAIRQAMRDYYAPLFNAGMRFNQHVYSGNDHSGTPIRTRIFATNPNIVTWDGHTCATRQTWWLEERARWYVAFCGFDGSKSTFEGDETGVDNPGPFDDFGFSLADKVAWALEFCRRNSEAMPDGAPYRFTSACLFADGDYNRWNAFAKSIRPMAQPLAAAGVY